MRFSGRSRRAVPGSGRARLRECGPSFGVRRVLFWPLTNPGGGRRRLVPWLAVALVTAGCRSSAVTPWQPVAPRPAEPAYVPLLPGDHPLKAETLATSPAPAPAAQRLDVVLRVMHVLVPRTARTAADTVWQHVREDALDSATTLRLWQNGLRVGVGDAEWWDEIRTQLDAITDVRALAALPLRLPPNYPLALELDTAPHAQTLFFMNPDGVLTGETWPRGRNVLRVSYDLDLARPDHVQLMVVPEVRQQLEGWRWVRSEAGLIQEPDYSGRAFGAAGFLTGLAPGDFLVVGPGTHADVRGLVGHAFLTREEDGRSFDSYIFMRADVNHVVQRD